MSIEKIRQNRGFFVCVGCWLFSLSFAHDGGLAHRKKRPEEKITQEAQVLVMVSPTVDPLTWMVKEVRKVNRLRDC